MIPVLQSLASPIQGDLSFHRSTHKDGGLSCAAVGSGCVLAVRFTMTNKRQGPGACVAIIGGFGNLYGATVQRRDRGPPCTSGTLTIDVAEREEYWLRREEVLGLLSCSVGSGYALAVHCQLSIINYQLQVNDSNRN
jgi:hypothetical protein